MWRATRRVRFPPPPAPLMDTGIAPALLTPGRQRLVAIIVATALFMQNLTAP